MFDPFGDFETAGYLRNVRKEKDEKTIKRLEHDVFRANLPDALDFLSKSKTITYKSFLKVHRILFFDIYPWAGQDRLAVLPNRAITKGNALFCHPQDIRRAVDSGLRLAQQTNMMSKKPGEIMGLFAYGHPFLAYFKLLVGNASSGATFLA